MSAPGGLTAGRILRRALWRHRLRLSGGMIMTSGYEAAEAAVPIAIGIIIDLAVSTSDLTAMGVSLAGLGTLFVVLTLAWRFGARQTVTVAEREAHQLRMEVTARLLDPRGQRDQARAGDLLSIATLDAERLSQVVHVVAVGLGSFIGIAVSAVALLVIDVPLGIGVLLGVPLLVGLLQLLAPRITRRSAAQQAATGRTTALASDLVTGLRTLRGIGAQHQAAARYRDSSGTTLRAALRAASTNGVYHGLTAAVSLLFLAAVAGFAGWLAISGRMSVGELVTVVGLAQFIAEPVKSLGFAGQMLATARGSAARLAEVLNAPPRLRTGYVVPGQARVECHAVEYRSLRGLDLAVRPGETVAVLSHDPANAGDLVELLSSRVAPTEHGGRVLLDGAAIDELDLDAARATMLVQPHDVRLFEGTIRSNVLAGTLAEDSAVNAALHCAAADDVVESHPEGLDHPVADRGATLSGGQRQRLGLARALLVDPPILVLHDPTTAVDAVTEELIAARIATWRGGQEHAATLLVTSSPALLSRADRVVVLADGRVQATGRHVALCETDPEYAEAVLR